jgi:hypothetical protein
MSKRTRNGSPNWAGQSLTIAIALIFCCMPAHAQELNTILMNSTFKIVGPNATIKGNIIFGTVFIMAKPIKETPDRGYFVLITAAHVLDKIGGEEAVLQLRRKDAGGAITAFGTLYRYELEVQICTRPIQRAMLRRCMCACRTTSK